MSAIKGELITNYLTINNVAKRIDAFFGLDVNGTDDLRWDDFDNSFEILGVNDRLYDLNNSVKYLNLYAPIGGISASKGHGWIYNTTYKINEELRYNDNDGVVPVVSSLLNGYSSGYYSQVPTVIKDDHDHTDMAEGKTTCINNDTCEEGHIFKEIKSILESLYTSNSDSDCGNVTNGLIAHYPLNGNAYDIIGSHDGTPTPTAGVQWVSGKCGQAAYFDGNRSYIDIGDYRLDQDYLSISLWVRTNDGTKNYGVFSWNTWDGEGGLNIGVGINTDDTVQVTFRDDRWSTGSRPNIVNGNNISNDQWHHVVFVYDGDAHLFIDGNKKTISRGSTMYNTDLKIHIGHLVKTKTADLYLKGAVDDVRIYNRALSQNEIETLRIGN